MQAMRNDLVAWFECCVKPDIVMILVAVDTAGLAQHAVLEDSAGLVEFAVYMNQFERGRKCIAELSVARHCIVGSQVAG
jgi:hypothetical protein